MYLAVTAFIGLAAVNSQTNLLFWTFGLMVGAFAMSVLVSSATMRSIEVRRLLGDHGAVDEPMLIRYEIVNRKWTMPCFGLVISELDGEASGRLRGRPFGWIMHIGPRATAHATATAWPTHRGPVTFNRIRVATTFPFGILRKTITVSQPGRVLIYPKIHRLRRELLADVRSRDVAGSRVSAQGGGFEEFYGLREYRPGDAIKLIDWKHTVRTGKLVSRDMTRLTPPKLMVLLDVRDRDERTRADAETAIDFAASLICEAHQGGFEVGLGVAGAMAATFAPGHGRWHRTQILHALSEIDLSVATDGPGARPMSRDVNWLVVHAGEIDRKLGPPNAEHLTIEELEHWRLRPGKPATNESPVDGDAPDETDETEEVAA